MGSLLFAALFIALHFATGGLGNPDAKRLYDDLLSNYNRLIRPVGNNSDRLTVKMGLRLSQLIDVNLKNQIMTTNVWVEQEWNDYKLKWNPDDYGGVDTLHVPSEHIWLPDIVLYNNADGNYEVTIMTKAILHHTGKVVWKPPAIYKSFCEIDVEYFPFDEQTCFMKFGSWTYDGYMVDLRHLKQTADSDNIEVGIDLQDYYISVEWDIMRVPAVRNEKFYSCCEEPYLDIVFNLTLRRKTLFYTVNLIIPCVGISFLSVLVFYLPSDSGEKISLCISILLSLTVFFLLLAEIIPPTSLTVPLLGKYLLFTMMLVTLSVVVTIAVLNVNFRSPVTHKMAPWVQRLFIQILPKVLCIERPKKDEGSEDEQQPEVLTDVFHLPPDVEKFVNYDTKRFSGDYGIPALPTHRFEIAPSGIIGPCFGDPPLPSALPLPGGDDDLFSPSGNGDISPGCCAADISPTFDKPYAREMEKTIEGSRFIAQHVRNKDKFESVEEDWKYVAMVLDRLFLWIFTIACILGTALIILQAPSLYDHSQPIDILYSKIAKKKFELLKMGSEDV
ncbi:acetylcholine receptor subunit alpha-like 1 [Eupeodes corollae]|uniref:acetylcholine receptor subunit alpha-like 1 n=1 Tax=Eupeodes corollae TaxID=290404 RepID=UPI00248F95DD|nr:acetylcholine receptor subunit alpha-like 1 [Eupeodes corollae]XP_055905920.1 acetylcholine receptor subunit alpha-like 1 [Eupeodes corollae]